MRARLPPCVTSPPALSCCKTLKYIQTQDAFTGYRPHICTKGDPLQPEQSQVRFVWRGRCINTCPSNGSAQKAVEKLPLLHGGMGRKSPSPEQRSSAYVLYAHSGFSVKEAAQGGGPPTAGNSLDLVPIMIGLLNPDTPDTVKRIGGTTHGRTQQQPAESTAT